MSFFKRLSIDDDRSREREKPPSTDRSIDWRKRRWNKIKHLNKVKNIDKM